MIIMEYLLCVIQHSSLQMSHFRYKHYLDNRLCDSHPHPFHSFNQIHLVILYLVQTIIDHCIQLEHNCPYGFYKYNLQSNTQQWFAIQRGGYVQTVDYSSDILLLLLQFMTLSKLIQNILIKYCIHKGLQQDAYKMPLGKFYSLFQITHNNSKIIN